MPCEIHSTNDKQKNTFELFFEPNTHSKKSENTNTVSLPNTQKQKLLANPFRAGESLQYFFNEKDFWIRAIGIFIAIIVGAFHALLPGHSKTLLSGYMSSRIGAKKSEMLTLIASVTFSHTVSIFVLAIIIIVLGKGIGDMTKWLLWSSSFVYLAFGGYFLYRGWRLWKEVQKSKSVLMKNALQSPEDCCATHINGNFRQTLLAGILAGLNPCVDALALFVLALSLHDAVYASVIVVAFSLGLALALASLLFLLHYSHHFISKKSSHFAKKMIAGVTFFSGMLLIIFSLIHII